MMQTVLSLETSCDETAVAILQFDGENFYVKANCIASQASEHAKWGGVVPEMASRRHLENMPFLLEKALDISKINFRQIDAIAATVSPGLTGSLLIGSITARTLSCLHNKPFVGIHHLEGHLASILLSSNPPGNPYLVLLVSGGHTELIKVEKEFSFIRLGRSHDDAAGEAFDKVARLLDLPYPGGPAIQSVAKNGDYRRFSFPRPKVSKPEGGFFPYDFSFSGLKTSVLRKVQGLKDCSEEIPIADIAASFEFAVAEVLVNRSIKCALDQQINSLVVVGGVSANHRLREVMLRKAGKASINVTFPSMEFCTDNAAMIGAAALQRLNFKKIQSPINLGVSARFQLDHADLLYQVVPPF